MLRLLRQFSANQTSLSLPHILGQSKKQEEEKKTKKEERRKKRKEKKKEKKEKKKTMAKFLAKLNFSSLEAFEG